ncbi:MAG: hypothetical protein AAGC74_09475 [Verrucomicrobiota bacterium]
MKHLLISLLLALGLPAQTYYALLTLDVLNPLEEDRKIAIQLDTTNAPLACAQVILLSKLEEKYYTVLSESVLPGIVAPGSANLALAPSTGTLTVNNQSHLLDFTANTSATVYAPDFFGFYTIPLATFTLTNNGWQSSNPNYSLSYDADPINFPGRWEFKLQTNTSYVDENSGDLTTAPYYTNRDLTVSTSSGFFGFGRSRSTSPPFPQESPGWFLQNEGIMIPNVSFDAANTFANNFDTPYAVALANRGLDDLNRTTAEILVCGQNGDSTLNGRHTYLGQVVTSIPGLTINGINTGRFLTDELVSGTRDGTVTSVEIITTGSGNYDPIAFGSTDLPSLTESNSSNPSIIQRDGSSFFLTGAAVGDIRAVESSEDLINWEPVGESSFPPSATFESGFNLDILQINLDKAFYRAGQRVQNYPAWPAEAFSQDMRNARIRFKSKADDSGTLNPVLNVFQIIFDSLGQSALLQGSGIGDLAGDHLIDSITYTAETPYIGRLKMTSPTLSEDLTIRLYFDKQPNGQILNTISRFHRLEVNEITAELIPGQPVTFTIEQRTEFGIWQIQP